MRIKKYNHNTKNINKSNIKPKTSPYLNFKNKKYIYLNKFFNDTINSDEYLGNKVDSCFNTVNSLAKRNIITDDDCDKICQDIGLAIELAICAIANCSDTQIIIK